MSLQSGSGLFCKMHAFIAVALLTCYTKVHNAYVLHQKMILKRFHRAASECACGYNVCAIQIPIKYIEN